MGHESKTNTIVDPRAVCEAEEAVRHNLSFFGIDFGGLIEWFLRQNDDVESTQESVQSNK